MNEGAGRPGCHRGFDRTQQAGAEPHLQSAKRQRIFSFNLTVRTSKLHNAEMRLLRRILLVRRPMNLTTCKNSKGYKIPCQTPNESSRAAIRKLPPATFT